MVTQESKQEMFERIRGMPFESLLADERRPSVVAQLEAEASIPTDMPVPVQKSTGALYDSASRDRTFDLRHPFEIDGIRYERLRFQPPAFEDVEAVLRGDISEMEMHARAIGVPVSVLRALRWDDAEIVTFISRSLAPEFRT